MFLICEKLKKSSEKKINIFTFGNQYANVYFLQETFSNPIDKKFWSAEWRGQIFLFA